MKPDAHHHRGLNPTLRHQLIFVLFCGTVIAAHLGLYRAGFIGDRRDTVFSNLILYFLLWMPPWLSVLLLVFDRRGPVRQWYLACIMVAWAAIPASFSLADLASYVRCGRPTPVYPTSVFLSLLILVAMPRQISLILPAHCSQCDRKSVIPVLELGERGRASRMTDQG